MEKWPATKVVPFQGVWSDVGGWNALGGLWSEDQNNNHVLGNQAYLHKTHTSLVKASGRPVVTLGLENTLIVDTLDVLLVANRNHLDQMRDIVAGMSKVYPALTENHRQVRRPWGWYDSIEQGPGFQVKRLHLDAGASISLQRHKHRAEHWVIVAGHAKVQIEDKITLLSAGQSAYIPLGAVHRLINPADYPLEVVEVQTGDYLGEDDIERLEDIYGR
jgi:mannose-1-phosphate guanylyltransferase/mannose-6-phosphate isomerase